MRLKCNKHLTRFRVARGIALKKGKVLSARGAQQQQTAEEGDQGNRCKGTGQAAHATTIAGFAALRNGRRTPGERRSGQPALKPDDRFDQLRRRLSASQPDQT
jgi:hypothetical protein